MALNSRTCGKIKWFQPPQSTATDCPEALPPSRSQYSTKEMRLSFQIVGALAHMVPSAVEMVQAVKQIFAAKATVIKGPAAYG